MNRRFGILLCLPGLTLAGVSFPVIRTTVELASDGTARMVQELTCRFDGKQRQLRLSFTGGFHDTRVTVNGVAERSAGRVGPVEDVTTTEQDREFIVKWSPRAEDETRHYVIDLTVERAVRRYDDFARVYLAVVGRAPGPVELATVELRLPRPAARSFEPSEWSDATGTVSPDRSTANLEQRNMERGDRLVIDVLTDPEVFEDVRLRPGPMEKVEGAPRPDDHSRPLPEAAPAFRWWLVLILLLVPWALLVGLYYAFGREPRVSHEAIYEREPPGRIPPLAVPAIMRQQPNLTELPEQTLDATLATMLDAARKGVVELLPGDPKTGEGRGFVLAHSDRLKDLDELSRKVVDYYFTVVSAGRSFVTAEDVQRHAVAQPEAFLFWLKLMSQEGRYWWWSKLGVDFLEPQSSTAYKVFCYLAPLTTALAWLLVPLSFAFLSFDLTLRLRAVLMLVTFALSGAVYVYLGRVILRWSPPAYYEHLRWQKFRRFLVEFSAIEQAPVELLPLWGEYYVYAVALGIGEKFMHGLSSLGPAMSLAERAARSLHAARVGMGSGWGGAAFGLGLNQMLASFRSGSGLQGRRIDRLQPLMFWRVGRR